MAQVKGLTASEKEKKKKEAQAQQTPKKTKAGASSSVKDYISAYDREQENKKRAEAQSIASALANISMQRQAAQEQQKKTQSVPAWQANMNSTSAAIRQQREDLDAYRTGTGAAASAKKQPVTKPNNPTWAGETVASYKTSAQERAKRQAVETLTAPHTPSAAYKEAERYAAKHYNTVSEADIQSFFKNASDFLTEYQKKAKDITFGKDQTTGGDFHESWAELSSMRNDIRSFFNGYKKENGRSYNEEYEALLDEYDKLSENLSRGIRRGEQFYKQWNTESDYNNWVEQQKQAQKDYQARVQAQPEQDAALRSVDVDAGYLALDELVGYRDEIKGIKQGRRNVSMTQYRKMLQEQGINLSTEEFYKSYYSYTNGEGDKDKNISAVLKKAGYDTYEDLEKAITERRQLLRQAEQFQNVDKFKKEAKDDKEYGYWVLQGEKIENPTFEEADSGVFVFGKKIGGKQIGNPVTYARDNADKIGSGTLTAHSNAVNPVYALMTEDEVRVYNYWLAKELAGKAEAGKAQAFLSALLPELNERQGISISDNAEGHKATEGLIAYSSGLEQWGNSVKQIFSDEVLPAPASAYAAQAIREKKSGFEGVLFDLLQNFGNNTPGLAVGFLTSGVAGALGAGVKGAQIAGRIANAATLGAGAFGSAYAEMKGNGYSKAQSYTYATLNAASETGLEYLLGGLAKFGSNAMTSAGMKTLTEAAKSIDNVFLKFAAKFGTKFLLNGGSEFVEEASQNFLQKFFAKIVTGEKQEYDIGQALYDGLIGLLFAAPMNLVHGISSNASVFSEAREAYESGNYEKLIEIGRSFDEGTVARSIADTAGKGVSKTQLAMMLADIYEGMDTQIESDFMQALKNNGMSDAEAENNAKWLAAGARRGRYTGREAERMDADARIADAVFDLVYDRDSSINQRYNNLAAVQGREGEAGFDTSKLGQITPDAERSAARLEQNMRGAELKSPYTYGNFIDRAAIRPDSDAAAAQFNSEVVRRLGVDPAAFGRNVNGETGRDPVRIESIDKNGNAVFGYTDNRNTDAKNTVFKTGREALIWQAAAKLGADAKTANAIAGLVDRNGIYPVERQMLGLKEAFTYGRTGYDLRYVDEETTALQYLTHAQIRYAYDFGRKFRDSTYHPLTNREYAARRQAAANYEQKMRNGGTTTEAENLSYSRVKDDIRRHEAETGIAKGREKLEKRQAKIDRKVEKISREMDRMDAAARARENAAANKPAEPGEKDAALRAADAEQVKNAAVRQALEDYKAEAARLDEARAKLEDLNKKISALTEKEKLTPEEKQALKKLRLAARQEQNRIDTLEARLKRRAASGVMARVAGMQDAAAAGKIRATVDGKAVTVDMIGRLQDGKLVLIDTDGNELSLADAGFTGARAEAAKAFFGAIEEKMQRKRDGISLSADSANAALDAWLQTPEADPAAFVSEWHTVYAAAVSGLSRRTAAWLNVRDHVLTEEQLRAAWESTNGDVIDAPGVRYVTSGKISDAQAGALTAVDFAARKYGLKVVVADKIYSGGRLAQDYGCRDGKTLVLALETETGGAATTETILTLTFYHEAFHVLGQLGSQGRDFQNHITDEVLGYLKETMAPADYEALFKERESAYGNDRAKIREEIAAQYLGTLMAQQNSADLEARLQEAAAAQDKSFLEKFADRLRAFIGDLRAAIGRLAKRDRTVAAALEADVQKAENFVFMLDKALQLAAAEDAENKNPAGDGGVDHSFLTSKNGLGHDLLLPYDEQLRAAITKDSNNVIIETYDELRDFVNNAFANPKEKKNGYLGIIDYAILKKIEQKVANMPAVYKNGLFKTGKNYSILVSTDSLLHVMNEGHGSVADILSFVDRLADTILEADSVKFSYYEKGNNKSPGLSFEKMFVDGDISTFDLVTNNKRSLELKTIFYKQSTKQNKKKSATSMPVQKPSAYVQNAGGSNFYKYSTPNNQKSQQGNSNNSQNQDHSYNLDAVDLDRQFEIQQEIGDLNRQIRGIEDTEDFRAITDLLYSDYTEEGFDRNMRKYNEWKKKSGYGDLIDWKSRLTKELNDIQESNKRRYAEEAAKKEAAAIERSGLPEGEYFNRVATRQYGTTSDYNEAGYLTPTGKLLNFSGEKGVHRGSRGQDHRNIGIIFEDTHGSDAMNRFMGYGNIRVIAETPGVDIASETEPTAAQYRAIRQMASQFAGKGYFIVDLSDGDGNTVGSLEYEGRVNPERIVNDIKHYFETGEIRGQSDVERFHFSKNLDAVAEEQLEEESGQRDEVLEQTEILRSRAEKLAGAAVRDEDLAALLPGTNAITKILRNHNFASRDGKYLTEKSGTVHKMLQNLYTGRVSFANFMLDLQNLMQNEIENAGHWEPAGDGSVADFRREVRGSKIYLSPDIYDNVAESFGGRRGLRNAVMGKFWITSDADKSNGTALDVFYNDLLQKNYGLPETTDPTTQIQELLNLYAAGNDVWVDEAKQYEWFGETSKAIARDEALKLFEELTEATPMAKTAGADTAATNRMAALRETLNAERRAERAAALEEARNAAEQRANESAADEIKRVRIEAEERVKAAERLAERRIRDAETRAREIRESDRLRADIRRKVRAISKLLIQNANYDNVPEAAKRTVTKLMQLFQEDRDIFSKQELSDVAFEYGRILKGIDTAEFTEDGAEPENYTAFASRLDAGIAEEMTEMLGKLAAQGGKTDRIYLRRLTRAQAETVQSALDNISFAIRNANLIRLGERQENAATLGQRAIDEFNAAKRKPARENKWIKLADDYLGTKMLTPIYFFKEKLGGVFGELYEPFLDAQDGWARKNREAKDFLQATMEQYHFDAWKKQTTDFAFESANVREPWQVRLPVGACMEIYAWKKREEVSGQESSHLLTDRTTSETGGVVLSDAILEAQKKLTKQTAAQKNEDYVKFLEKRDKLNDAVVDKNRHKLTAGDIQQIVDSLTDEQKAYVDAVVGFMSTTTSAWGNEATMQQYGVRKFTEGYYFPYETPEEFTNRRFGLAEDTRLKNWGSAKRTVRHANTPLVLGDFTEVAAAHMQEMALYSSFISPLESLQTVYNFKEKVDGETSVAAAMAGAHGKAAADYINQFLTAINGGLRSDSVDDVYNRMTGKFKAAAVMGNASVVIQQPTAIMRATALINPRFFFGAAKKSDYAEMMEHCPTAIVKDMGGFDTAMGVSAAEWILDQKTAGQKISDALGWGAEKADAVTWTNIWNAVKRETRATTDLKYGTDEFWDACNKRFREIANYTQVYDSALSKSELMRSKAGLARMVTAFMAEPTLSYNLLVQSGREKSISKGRALTAFTLSVIVNAAFQSLVGAWRDKDEDKTYGEKWVKTFAGNTIGSKESWFMDSAFNPLGLVPWVKDLISIFSGWDVSRSDVSVFSELIQSAKKLAESIGEGTFDADKLLKFLSAASSLTPVPMKSLYKDATGIIRTIRLAGQNDLKQTGKTVWSSFVEGIGLERSADERAYFAVLHQNAEEIRRESRVTKADVQKYVKKGYSEKDAEEMAKKNAYNSWHEKIRNGLAACDPRVTAAADAKEGLKYKEYERLVEELQKDGFSQTDIVKAVEKVLDGRKTPTTKEFEPTAKDLYKKSEIADPIKAGDETAFRELSEALEAQGVEPKEIRSQAKSAVKDLYKTEEIDWATAERYLKTYAGMDDADDIYWTLDEWSYEPKDYDGDGETDDYGKYKEFYSAVQTGKDLKKVIKTYTDHGVTAKTMASQITSYFKPIYKEMTTAQRASLKGYLLNAYAALGYDRAKKGKDIDKWLED